LTKTSLVAAGALLTVALAAVIGMTRAGSGGPAQAAPGEHALATVRRGSLALTLTETGTLKTKNAATIMSEIAGVEKIAWLADEGASVTKGAIVIELDKTEVEKRIEELENLVIQGESELKTARTDLEIQEAQNRTDLDKAALRVEVAHVALKKLLDGDIPKEERTRKLAIDKAKSMLERAEEKYKSMPDLLALGFVTKSQVEEERLKVEEASVALETATQELELYQKFQRPLDQKQKQAEVDEAERDLERAKQKAASQLEQKQAVIRQRELTLKSTNDRLEKARKDLEKMTLRAPTDGIVVYGDLGERFRSREIKVGMQVWPNQTILTLPDTSELAVVVRVHEADIEKLKVGMPASVTLDTYKGLVLSGEVAKIASVANAGDSWLEEDVKKFSVDIAVKDRNQSLRPGITAKVEITVGEVKDALYVPSQAVFAREGKFRCFVRAAGRTVAREVEIGRANDQHVEVKKGLELDERVVLYNAEAAEVDAAAPPASAAAKP
jgi:HlyD family secretion protein